LKYFADLPDPRIDRRKDHALIDIITIAILATICGADYVMALKENQSTLCNEVKGIFEAVREDDNADGSISATESVETNHGRAALDKDFCLFTYWRIHQVYAAFGNLAMSDCRRG